MTTETATNRRFYEGPDVETLNILIELGEIVKHSPEIEWQVIPKDMIDTEAGLLQTAASTIHGIKALRKWNKAVLAAKRLQERVVAKTQPVPRGSYDFRLAVFREGGE